MQFFDVLQPLMTIGRAVFSFAYDAKIVWTFFLQLTHGLIEFDSLISMMQDTPCFRRRLRYGELAQVE